MSSVNSRAEVDTIANVLTSVREKGVRLWSEKGQLYYKAPKGVLTLEEIERLRLSRSQIISILERDIDAFTAERASERYPRLNRIPLTFSQLAHLRLHQLHRLGNERNSMRLVASATRLRGPLNIEALRQVLAEVVRRHDALRTRIVICDGIHMQETAESWGDRLTVEDLTVMPESFRELEINRRIEKFIMAPIDLTADPLFGVQVLKVRGDYEHVLIVAMDHMISDGSSLNIFEREIFDGYTQALQRRHFSLPEIPTQFTDHAIRQWTNRGSWVEKHGPYWDEHLAGCRRLRFPHDRNSSTNKGWGIVPLRISKELKAELREWCRMKQTTLVMGVFTAYVALVLRWCNASSLVVQYQSNGRIDPEVQNAIGFFASPLYLRLELRNDDSFTALAKRVTGEYCNAYEHADFSYLATILPRPEFTRNTVFNWSPRGAKPNLCEIGDPENIVACSPIHFVHPMLENLDLDHEPEIALYDVGDEIAGEVYFPQNRFSADTMERFGRNFLIFVRALLTWPERHVVDISLI